MGHITAFVQCSLLKVLGLVIYALGIVLCMKIDSIKKNLISFMNWFLRISNGYNLPIPHRLKRVEHDSFRTSACE